MTDKTCCCFEIAGDNENCPIHNDPRTDEEKEQDERDADWGEQIVKLRNGD